MTGAVVRVGQPVQWVYDRRRGYIEPGEVADVTDVTETERIEMAVKDVNNNNDRLVEAVRLARAAGRSWSWIGGLLGITRQAAQQRFGPLVDPSPLVKAPEPDPVFDFSDINSLSTEQLIEKAATLPRDTKLGPDDAYMKGLREAIVIALYRREMNQRRIAEIIGRSSQRVSQIVTQFYDRQAREWALERASWNSDKGN